MPRWLPELLRADDGSGKRRGRGPSAGLTSREGNGGSEQVGLGLELDAKSWNANAKSSRWRMIAVGEGAGGAVARKPRVASSL